MTKSQKDRRFSRLTIHDRDLIEIRYCFDYKKISEIAKELKRPISTITREINPIPRVDGGRYNTRNSQKMSLEKRAHQGRKSKLDTNKNYDHL